MSLSSQLTEGSINTKIAIQSSLGKKHDPISKMSRKGWGVAQVAECLYTKHGGLSSNPGTAKQTKKSLIVINQGSFYFVAAQRFFFNYCCTGGTL
jgi:hypothetical protein